MRCEELIGYGYMLIFSKMDQAAINNVKWKSERFYAASNHYFVNTLTHYYFCIYKDRPAKKLPTIHKFCAKNSIYVPSHVVPKDNSI